MTLASRLVLAFITANIVNTLVLLTVALPLKSSNRVHQNTTELWCSDDVDVNITNLQKGIKAQVIRLRQYVFALIDGHRSSNDFKIEGLVEQDKCSSIVIPTHPVSSYSNGRQDIANKLWKLSLLKEMFKNTFKLIKLHQSSSVSDRDVSKLTTMQVMINHFVESVEEYLMAERCSCKDTECTLHHVTTAAIEEIMDQARLELRPSKCTRMNLLRGVLNMVYNETGPKTPIGDSFNVTPSAFKLCHIFSSANYPDGCPVE